MIEYHNKSQALLLKSTRNRSYFSKTGPTILSTITIHFVFILGVRFLVPKSPSLSIIVGQGPVVLATGAGCGLFCFWSYLIFLPSIL